MLMVAEESKVTGRSEGKGGRWGREMGLWTRRQETPAVALRWKGAEWWKGEFLALSETRWSGKGSWRPAGTRASGATAGGLRAQRPLVPGEAHATCSPTAPGPAGPGRGLLGGGCWEGAADGMSLLEGVGLGKGAPVVSEAWRGF